MLDEKITKSRSVRQLDEIIFSSGTSRVTVPDELNEILLSPTGLHFHIEAEFDFWDFTRGTNAPGNTRNIIIWLLSMSEILF